MMKTGKLLLIFVLLCTTIGCDDIIYLEDVEIPLVLGLDVDPNDPDQLIYYSSAPVFSKDAQKKYTVRKITAHSLEVAKNKIGGMSTGFLVGGKLQVILISKKLLQHKNVFPYLDVLYRSPKNETKALVAMVDGSIEEIMNADMKDKGILGVVIHDIIQTSFDQGITVCTRLLDFFHQMIDKRITPNLTELKMEDGEITVYGTALLNKEAKYSSSLNILESTLLLILRKETANQLPLSFSIPQDHQKNAEINLAVNHINYDIQSDYRDHRFQFTMNMALNADISERLFPYEIKSKQDQLERILTSQLDQEFNQIIHKIQAKQLDPMGLGVYAQAFQYPHWQKVKTHWGKELSKATIKVKPHIVIRDFGITF
ncbi:Ger(x)C family spore germination protein [Marininema halotolerans]|uniref:Germination protein, Ger(X)C family n=1 Tax=Marininema halotolerans TaxID=1155944 RepID=A0A1I6TLM4_9BACL|nr:Ger(x)C family spore germination protein [Marininema halotolerans]SFS90030.1 germination protein, Ger(x)C family [Marininema halotolerans]